MDGWVDGCVGGWMDGWVGGWMDGIEYKMCVFIFSTVVSEEFIILRRSEPDMIINVYRSASCKVHIILVSF
jgi:hypothetical protein